MTGSDLDDECSFLVWLEWGRLDKLEMMGAGFWVSIWFASRWAAQRQLTNEYDFRSECTYWSVEVRVRLSGNVAATFKGNGDVTGSDSDGSCSAGGVGYASKGDGVNCAGWDLKAA
jgi:hypothetical protein